MTSWISFFAEYNFEVKYKLGRQNALADALPRRPDYELAHVTTFSSPVTDLISAAYTKDDQFVALLHALTMVSLKTRTLSCRHVRVRAYIDILSIKGCCTIVQMRLTRHELWFLPHVSHYL